MAKLPIKKKEKVLKEKSKKPKKEKKKKKKKKVNKKKTKVQIVISFILLLVLAALFFLMFGGDKVPEQIRNAPGYSYINDISDSAKEKLPDKLKLPVDLPFEVPKLHFDIPNPFAGLLGNDEPPNEEKIKTDLTGVIGGEKSKAVIESIEIEKRDSSDKKEDIYVAVEITKNKETTTAYYKLQYKKAFIGGWKLKKSDSYNVEGEKTSVAGVNNDIVLKDYKNFKDIPAGWKVSNFKVMEHYTDAKAGMDTVVVFMKMKTDCLIMEGTREITYTYNNNSKKWEMTGQPSKLSCTYVEPLVEPQSQ